MPAVAQVTDVPLRPEDVRPQFFPSDIAVRETEFSPYIGVRATAEPKASPSAHSHG